MQQQIPEHILQPTLRVNQNVVHMSQNVVVHEMFPNNNYQRQPQHVMPNFSQVWQKQKTIVQDMPQQNDAILESTAVNGKAVASFATKNAISNMADVNKKANQQMLISCNMPRQIIPQQICLNDSGKQLQVKRIINLYQISYGPTQQLAWQQQPNIVK
ncbi:868_t:CDS:2, partial [Gigaspora rosea]